MTNSDIAKLLIDYGAVQDPTEITPLYRAVEGLNPKTILEVGVEGGGTLKLWSTLLGSDGLLVGVDMAPTYRWIDEDTDCERLFIQGNSQEEATIDKVRSVVYDRGVDFLFIDADHTQEGVTRDYNNYSPLVRPGGIIGFHDINDNCGVKQFWTALDAHKYEFINRIGIGFIVKEEK